MPLIVDASAALKRGIRVLFTAMTLRSKTCQKRKRAGCVAGRPKWKHGRTQTYYLIRPII